MKSTSRLAALGIAIGLAVSSVGADFPSPTPTEPMRIIAHRGASGQMPENTLASVRRAWELGADGVEVDAHLSRDGQAVVIHDQDTQRTGNRVAVIAEHAWEDLKDIDVGAWKGKPGEKLCLLEEVIATRPEGKILFLEIKGGSHAGWVDWIRRAGPPDPATTYWISFRHDLLDAVKSAFPTQQTLLLVGDENFPYNPNTRHQGYGIAKKLILEPAVLASLSEKGKVWSVWTENDPARAAYWRGAGFRFLTTDHPDRFKDR